MGEPRELPRALDERVLNQLFSTARSHNGWLTRPVDDELLLRLYDLVKMGPTSLNCCPARFIFIRTPANKERLRGALAPANVAKVMGAPVVAIIGYDLDFHAHLPRLFQHRPEAARPFQNNPALAQETAFRNGTLQGAYLMLAARSLGLDCGPLSGFDAEYVTGEFFAGTRIRANFLCCLGHGDPQLLFPKLPRFEFSEVCTLA
ncbi:MAG: malonic semialdehyde reductase [Proteobacteria bacterium]|nr:malonic semialdehyde reductase [Pseudomonadota bacterium]